jgi:hypothetical protein
MLSAPPNTPGLRRRVAITTFLVLVVLVFIEVILTSLFTGHLANGFNVYPLQNAGLYSLLWESNPGKTLELLLITNPIVIIEHLDAGTQTQSWGIYYYLTDLMLLVGVALVTAIAWVSGRLQHPGASRILVSAGGLLMVVASTHLKLGACCGSSPRWVVDAMILSRLYDPRFFQAWGDVYEAVAGLFMPVQVIMVLGGTGCVIYGWVRKKS